MPQTVLVRPAAADHAEYYNTYIRLVPAGDLVAIMQAQIQTLASLLQPVSHAQAGFAYAPGKWTLREVIGHLTDTERVFAYRATAFSRGDAQPLPGFDQETWNPLGEYDCRPLDAVLDEWTAVRTASVALIRSMPEVALQRRGPANGREISVLACLCILPGHVNYHIDHLQTHYQIGEREAVAR